MINDNNEMKRTANIRNIGSKWNISEMSEETKRRRTVSRKCQLPLVNEKVVDILDRLFHMRDWFIFFSSFFIWITHGIETLCSFHLSDFFNASHGICDYNLRCASYIRFLREFLHVYLTAIILTGWRKNSFFYHPLSCFHSDRIMFSRRKKSRRTRFIPWNKFKLRGERTPRSQTRV
jgi:hypothetical protein